MTRPCLPPRSAMTALNTAPPANACDAHLHIFGPYDEFALADERSYTPDEADVHSLIAHLDRTGMQRGVIVNASAYGTDNRALLHALSAEPARLRGVAVVNGEVSDAELDVLHAAGVRGARFNLYQLNGHSVYRNGAGLEDLQRLAPRLKERGWHAQIWIHAPDLPALASTLFATGVELVIDHMGRMSTARGTDEPGFRFLCEALKKEQAWVKISGADRNTTLGPPYDDVTPFAQQLLAANGDRVVWGSDWPHINYFDAAKVPDDGVLQNTLMSWIQGTPYVDRVLVHNPARLYGF